MEEKPRKPAHFIPPTQKNMGSLPGPVEDAFGWAILDAQYGDFPVGARPFGEGLATGILKLLEDYDGNTYRLSFTLDFSEAVYVLDVFRKKSTRGIKTPQVDKDRVKKRYQTAKAHHTEHYDAKRKNRK